MGASSLTHFGRPISVLASPHVVPPKMIKHVPQFITYPATPHVNELGAQPRSDSEYLSHHCSRDVGFENMDIDALVDVFESEYGLTIVNARQPFGSVETIVAMTISPATSQADSSLSEGPPLPPYPDKYPPKSATSFYRLDRISKRPAHGVSRTTTVPYFSLQSATVNPPSSALPSISISMLTFDSAIIEKFTRCAVTSASLASSARILTNKKSIMSFFSMERSTSNVATIAEDEEPVPRLISWRNRTKRGDLWDSDDDLTFTYMAAMVPNSRKNQEEEMQVCISEHYRSVIEKRDSYKAVEKRGDLWDSHDEDYFAAVGMLPDKSVHFPSEPPQLESFEFSTFQLSNDFDHISIARSNKEDGVISENLDMDIRHSRESYCEDEHSEITMDGEMLILNWLSGAANAAGPSGSFTQSFVIAEDCAEEGEHTAMAASDDEIISQSSGFASLCYDLIEDGCLSGSEVSVSSR